MKTLTLILLTLVALLALACFGCSSADIKEGARISAAAAQGGIEEFATEVDAGQMDAADASFVNNILGEVRDASDKVANDPRDFDKLGAADKRQIVEDYVAYVNERAQRLQAEGALHIKSDRARTKFNTVTRDVGRALSIARVVEAALPPAQPSASAKQQ